MLLIAQFDCCIIYLPTPAVAEPWWYGNQLCLWLCVCFYVFVSTL